MAEAATLEPPVALRRFVENALAPATVAEQPELVDADHGAPARDGAASGRRGPRRLRQARRSTRYDRLGGSLRRRSSCTATADVVVDPRTPTCSSSCIPDARLERVPGRGPPLLLGGSPSGSSRRSQSSSEERDGNELTIGRWLADRARLTPDRVAIDFLGARADLRGARRARATRLAAGLAERGLRRGDRLATLTRNSPDHVATLFACARLGVALQPISWRLAPAEVAYQLDDAEPALLLASDDHAELARKAGRTSRSRGSATRRSRPTARSRTSRATTTRCSSSTRPGRPASRRAPSSPTRTASGRTSRSTGRRACATTTSSSRCCRSSTSAAGTCSRCSRGGRARRSCSSRRSTPARALELIAEHASDDDDGRPGDVSVHGRAGDDFASADLSSLRLAVVGGAPMPESLLETWHERGIEIVQGYG